MKEQENLMQIFYKNTKEFLWSFLGVVAEWPVVLLCKQTRIFMQPITEALRLL